MFKMITWPQYLGAVALLLVVYYAYVALVYYRAELTGLISGKGKAAGTQISSATPTSLLNRGPLIPKAAVVLPVPATIAATTDKAVPDAEVATDEPEDEQEQKLEEETSAGVAVEAPDEANQEAQQEANEETDGADNKNQFDNFINKEDFIIDKSINFMEAKLDAIAPAVHDGNQELAEEFEEDFTVGVAQLNNIFDRAAQGELNKEQIEREVPELENTNVLMAFFKDSTKSAQQLTAATYANVADPAFD
jgi:hypothetical protein